MKYHCRWTGVVLSALTFGIACGDDPDAGGGPASTGSGAAGRGGSSAGGSGGPPVGGAGGLNHGIAGGADPKGTPGDGGAGGAVSAASAGEQTGGVGGQGGEAVQPGHWLAFQLWTEDENTHPLFVTGVPPQEDAVELAPDVDFWQWAPDGTRLVYATPAAYGGPPNAAFSVAVSTTGALGAPERLHEPLGEGALALRVSISPDSNTLALQLYEDGVATWYLRPIDGGVGDWMRVTSSVPGAETAATSEVRFMWSPDGTRAAIIQREDATHDALFIVDAVTGEGSHGSFGTLRPFQWSADGSRLFADALGPGAGQRVLYAIDADAASSAVELSDPAVHYDFDPTKFAVSSDGDTVAFGASAYGASGGLALLKHVASAQPAEQVGTSPQGFVWSERSEQFFFNGSQDLGVHLFAVPRQGGDAVRLSPEGEVAACNAPPCLRAAGDALLLMTFDAEYTGNQLYDIDLSTPSPSARRLTTFADQTRIEFLAVSPDSSQVLLFATDAAGKQGIYLVERGAAEPNVTRLFKPAGGAATLYWPLGWSPDSRYFDLRADPDKDGYIDLFAVTAGSDKGALPAPLTPQGRKTTGVDAVWRPRPLP
jgi:hypothetical protein